MARILSQNGVGSPWPRPADFTPAALASSSRIGAPRLQEWIGSRQLHLITIRISSRVAPAASAARIWRRVPSALRFVLEDWSAMQISSMSLTGKTPLVHGFVLIFRYFSAQSASHSVNLSGSALAVSLLFIGVLLF